MDVWIVGALHGLTGHLLLEGSRVCAFYFTKCF